MGHLQRSITLRHTPDADGMSDDDGTGMGSDNDASRGYISLRDEGVADVGTHVLRRPFHADAAMCFTGRLTICESHPDAPDPNCHGCLLRCVECNMGLRLRHFAVHGRGGTSGVCGRFEKCLACTRGPRIKERFKAMYAAAMLHWNPPTRTRKTWDDLVASGCMDPWRLHEFDWLLGFDLSCDRLRFGFDRVTPMMPENRYLPECKKAWLEEMLAPSNVYIRPN